MVGGYLGYYGAFDNLLKEDYYGVAREGLGNFVGIQLASAKGNIFGIGWTLGWNVLGPWVTNTEAYNHLFFGKNSARYQYLERQNGWYESKLLKD